MSQEAHSWKSVPQTLADKSKVFLKNQPSRMLLPWVQLRSSSLLMGRRMKVRKKKMHAHLFSVITKKPIKRDRQFWAPRRGSLFSLCPDVSRFTKSKGYSQGLCSE